MNLTEFRSENPQYDDISDVDLTKRLHAKFYSDLPFDTFNARFNAPSEDVQQDDTSVADQPRGVTGRAKDYGLATGAAVANTGSAILEAPKLVGALASDKEAPSYVDSLKKFGGGLSDLAHGLFIDTFHTPDEARAGGQRALKGAAEAAGGVSGVVRRGLGEFAREHPLTSMVAAKIGDSAANTAAQDKLNQWSDAAIKATSPEFQAAITKQAVDQDEQGDYHWGAGVTDPDWWVNGGINVGVQMPFMVGPGALAARSAYAGSIKESMAAARVAYGLATKDALASAAEAEAPHSVALEYAQKKAQAAAQRAAVIAGGLSEGGLSGAQDAQQTEETINQIDEETLMKYAPYRALRQQGMSHEEARGVVARDKALAVGIASATVVGLTGAPLNSWIGKWATVGTKAGIIKRTLGGVAAEGTQEGVQSGAEQLIQNKAEQPIDNKGTWDQVLNQTVTGALAVAPIGALGGAAAGHGGHMGEEATPVKDAFDKFNETKAKVDAQNTQLHDPTIRIDHATMEQAAEEHKQATVDLGHALLKAGYLDEATQKKLSGELQQAAQDGVTPTAVETPPPADLPATKDKTLSKDETDRLAALHAVANAEPVDDETLHNLVANGLAKVSVEGQPVLLPEGRRQRTALTTREEAAAEAEKPSSGATEKPKSAPAESSPIANSERPAAPAAKTLKAKTRSVDVKTVLKTMLGRVPTESELNATMAQRSVQEAAGTDTGVIRAAYEKAQAQQQAKLMETKQVPHEPALRAAEAYKADNNIQTLPPVVNKPINPALGKRIADAYDAMPHAPTDPKVKAAYSAMAKETLAQWQAIKKTGLKVEFIKPGQADPYAKSPRMAINDVRHNNHLWVFPTDSGFGNGSEESKAALKDNPMLVDTGEKIGDHKMVVNDVFRIVHDYFGHIQHGNGFRMTGEEAAWRIHSAMYSPEARAAMTSETRGQNSWVNHGPHAKANRSANGVNTVYAPQKIGLLPDEFHTEPQHTLKTAVSAVRNHQAQNGGTAAQAIEAVGKRDGFTPGQYKSLRSLFAQTEDKPQHTQTTAIKAVSKYIEDHKVDATEAIAAVGKRDKMTPGQMSSLHELYAGVAKKNFAQHEASPAEDKSTVSPTGAAQPGQLASTKPSTKEAVAEAIHKVSGLLTESEKASLNRASAKKLADIFAELPSDKDFASAALAGQAKRGWYKRSAEAMSRVFGPDSPRFAALMAALSPQTSVEQNFQNAVAVWAAWDKAGRPVDKAAIFKIMQGSLFPGNNRLSEPGVLPAWVPNTVRALAAANPDTVVLSGPKVDSFAANLRGESNRVTLDAWMATFAKVDQTLFSGSLTKRGNPGMRAGYLAYTARVRQAANTLTKMTGEKWTPAEVQETVWSWAKTLYEHASSYGGMATARDILESKELTDELINATPDFATQFANPVAEQILRDAGYGERLDQLHGAQASAGTQGKKAAPLAGDSKRLAAAADRLDEVRAKREAAAEEKKGAAQPGVTASTNEPLLAPNGKPSKLNAGQYKQVRTPEFKKWFGDWEKFATVQGGVWNDDEKSVSKIVDPDTGEPMVVYHATPRAGFREFDPSMSARKIGAVFFTSSLTTAKTYGGHNATEAELALPGEDVLDYEGRPGYYPVYLNMRNPEEEYFEGANWDGTRHSQYEAIDKDGETVYKEDGTRFFDNEQDAADFVENNPDAANYRPAPDEPMTTDGVVKGAKAHDADGAYIHDVVDDGNYGGYGDAVNVYAIFNPTNVKSATQNEGKFDAANPDIAAMHTENIPDTGMAREDVERAVKTIRNTLGVPVHVVQHVSELGSVGQRLGTEVAGLFVQDDLDPFKGKVFLVGDNISSKAHAENTILHEVVGHMGLRAVLGTEYEKTMDQIAESFPVLTAKHGKLYGYAVSKGNTKLNQAARRMGAEEVVAYATGAYLQRKGVGARQGIWSRIVGIVRKALRKIGALKNWSTDDIHNLIFESRNFVRKARTRNMKGRMQYAADLQRAAASTRPLGNAPGNPDLDSFLNKVGSDKATLRDKWKHFKSTFKDRAIMATLDQFRGIMRAANLAGVSAGDAGYFNARLSGSSAELVQSMMEFGHPVWNGGAPDVAGGMGFLDIVNPLGDKVNHWLAYLVAKRADRLASEGRENLFNRKEIDAALALGKQNPEFEVAAKKYAEFQKAVLDFAQEAGIINPDSRALWENSDYIPFHRLVENGEVQQHANGGKGLGFVKNQIVKLKGGRANIGDPMENIVRNWLALMDASLKAHAARAVVDGLDGTGLVNKAQMPTPVVPAHNVKAFIQANPTLVASLKAIGLDVNKLTPAQLRGLQSQLSVPPPKDEGTIAIWRNGQREHWAVHDTMLFQSLQGINAKAWGPLMEILRAPKRWLTATVTITPQFLVKNAWRDMWHTFIIGTRDGKTITPIVDTVKGTIQSMKMDKTSQSMLAGGASFAHGWIYGGDTAGGAAAIRRTIKAHHKGAAGIVDTPLKLFRFYRKLQNASENANRVALYERALKAGKSRTEALYEARDILDFSMKGASPVTQFLVQSVPFLNARAQGLYRLGRLGGKKAVAAVFLRGAILAALSLTLLASHWDDKRYKALSDDQKSNYWHLWDVFEKGDHWQIPKPFETGAVFGTIPEIIGDAILTNHDEPDRAAIAAKLVGYTFAQQLNLAPQPAAIWPMVELATNKNSYTGAPILTEGDKDVLPEDQVGPNTSPTYRAIAQLMPSMAPEAFRSPKQLEFLARAYMGDVQDYVLLATDRIVRAANGEPTPETPTSNNWPGLRDFRKVGPASHTKYMDSMYDIADQATKVYSSIQKASKQGTDEGEARAEQLTTDNEQLLSVRKNYDKAVQDVSGLKKNITQIRLDPTMPPDEKRKEIDDIQTEIGDIAEGVWDLRPGGKYNNDVGAELLTAPDKGAVLRKHNMPATADLLDQARKIK